MLNDRLAFGADAPAGLHHSHRGPLTCNRSVCRVRGST